MNRDEAEKKLKKIFGISKFYDRQWDVIESLLDKEKNERILMVEKTGFGKSLCFQFPATQFPGLTIVFSPLIALMRDQIRYLKKVGISAGSINSEQETKENRKILEQAINNKLKILYIAPERQNDPMWVEAIKKIKLSMIVIDEAHCISVWGHDFRPAFKKIVNLSILSKKIPILAITATATEQVAQDIKKQLGADEVKYVRGDLLRDNFDLNVIKVDKQEEKMINILEIVNNIDGFGIIYVGKREEAFSYSNFLKFNKVNSIAYHAGLDALTRKKIESGMFQNKYKCIVSTNALGMGIDKNDIRFIIHTQIPQSLIHYYQEIGRAGRDNKKSKIVLFYHKQDFFLPKYFIEIAQPTIDEYETIVNILKNHESPIEEDILVDLSNFKKSKIRTIVGNLISEGLIKEIVMKNRLLTLNNNNKINFDKLEQIRKFKFQELEDMINYVHTYHCRMRALQNYLGDKSTFICNKCDNCQKG